MEKWKTVIRPGHLGRYRDERLAEWDAQYGQGNWRVVHSFGKAVLDFLGACAVYEDAYFRFLEGNPDITHMLVAEASDVWDDARTNVSSGLDYLKQETDRTHIQDISIRRCLARMGLRLEGKELIQIRDSRGTHPLSLILSPGQVPFHRLDLIIEPQILSWWMPFSVESWYQSNKFLQVRK